MLEILPVMASGRQVAINGYAVPRVEAQEDSATGQWHVCYDGRFSVVAESLEELQRWLWLIAQAQAVGEGYSCHGENSVYRPNPHQLRLIPMKSVQPASTGTPAS